MTASAPATNRLPRKRSPCLLILPSRSLPPLECCLGTSPIQAEKLRPDRKVLGSATRNQRSCKQRADPGNVMKALARLVGPKPGQNHPIELQNLALEAEQLSTERGKARAGNHLSFGSAT